MSWSAPEGRRRDSSVPRFCGGAVAEPATIADVLDEQLLRLIEGDEASARAMSTERLSHYVEHARKGEQRHRLALQGIERMLALRRNAAPVDDDVLTSSGMIHLKNKTIDELLFMKKYPQDQLKRYEQALRTATPVLNERKP